MAIRILIVEDSIISRTAMISHLPKTMEFEVTEAEDGHQAIELYQEVRPDLVLLDLTMPVLDGYVVLERFLKMDPKARVVVITADTQIEAKRRCLAAGARAVLNKPVRPADLEAVIQEHAGK